MTGDHTVLTQSVLSGTIIYYMCSVGTLSPKFKSTSTVISGAVQLPLGSAKSGAVAEFVKRKEAGFWGKEGSPGGYSSLCLINKDSGHPFTILKASTVYF